MGAQQNVNGLKHFGRVLVGLLLALQMNPVAGTAQTGSGYQTIRIQVYVFNQKDGSAVPGVTVYFEETGGQRCGNAAKSRLPQGNYLSGGETNPDGIVILTEPVCPGDAVVYVVGGGFGMFKGDRTEFTIEPGVTNYNLELSLEPKAQRPSFNSNKFLNPKTRTLHVIVKAHRGKQLVPVHYASIYDQSGKLLGRTNYQGVGVFQHKEVYGETVTLRAVPTVMPGNDEGWEAATGSFIVGAAEKGIRTTRSEDYVNIVLGGNNTSSEKHPLDVLVRGFNPSKKNACRCVRIAGATIVDAEGHTLGTTDSTGRVQVIVDAPLGETYKVKAKAQHWAPQTKELESGTASGVGVTYAHESVEFMLDPLVEHGELTVEVLDRDTNEPVHGAEVVLYKPEHYPGIKVGESSTNSKGEAVFSAQDIDEALLNGEARVEAKHGGWESSTQTVSESLISGTSPRYVMYIKQKTEKTNWSGTWYSGPYTIQISGGTGSLGYQFLRSEGAGTCCPLVDQGSGNCKVQGSEATCTENAHYHDSAKDVQRMSTVTLRLSGDIISSLAKVKTASITLSSGQPCPDIAQCTGLHPGAEFSGTWTRKKP